MRTITALQWVGWALASSSGCKPPAKAVGVQIPPGPPTRTSRTAAPFIVQLQGTRLAKAVVTPAAQDEVIDHIYREQRAGLDDRSCEVDVLPAWLRITGRMVVSKYYGTRASGYGRRENLARLDRNVGCGTNGDDFHSDYAKTSVQHQHSQRLLVSRPERSQMPKRLARPGDRRRRRALRLIASRDFGARQQPPSRQLCVGCFEQLR